MFCIVGHLPIGNFFRLFSLLAFNLNITFGSSALSLHFEGSSWVIDGNKREQVRRWTRKGGGKSMDSNAISVFLEGRAIQAVENIVVKVRYELDSTRFHPPARLHVVWFHLQPQLRFWCNFPFYWSNKATKTSFDWLSMLMRRPKRDRMQSVRFNDNDSSVRPPPMAFESERKAKGTCVCLRINFLHKNRLAESLPFPLSQRSPE